jgi:hypothetical protein
MKTYINFTYIIYNISKNLEGDLKDNFKIEFFNLFDILEIKFCITNLMDIPFEKDTTIYELLEKERNIIIKELIDKHIFYKKIFDLIFEIKKPYSDLSTDFIDSYFIKYAKESQLINKEKKILSFKNIFKLMNQSYTMSKYIIYLKKQHEMQLLCGK